MVSLINPCIEMVIGPEMVSKILPRVPRLDGVVVLLLPSRFTWTRGVKNGQIIMYSVPPLLGTLEGLRRFPGAALSRVKNKVDIHIPEPL
jgi:hypothetical protein